MNYFFGIKTENIYSNITIPRFQNQGNANTEYLLCKANIKNSTWNVEVLNNNKINNNFYLIEEDISNNENIFCIDSFDIDTWIKKIEEIFYDQIRLKKISKNGKNLVMKYYNLEKFTEKLNKLIKEIS